MLDPFTFYSRIISATMGMADTAQRASETLVASRDVINRRTAMMGEAVFSPLDGNYAEFGKMIPEKVEAFGKAGAAIANDWWAIQSTFLTEAQHFGAIVMKGRAPTFSELSALSKRNTAFALRTFERAAAISAGGLMPIHASATANAKRLMAIAA